MNTASPVRSVMPLQDGPQHQHKRAKSASVLKSIISSKPFKPAAINDSEVTQPPTQGLGIQLNGYGGKMMPLLPADHHHAGHSELQNPSAPSSPRKSTKTGRPKMEALLGRGKSSESSTRTSDEKDKSDYRPKREKAKALGPKKSKSTTSLTGLFKNNRSSRDLTTNAQAVRDKENTTPPGSSSNHASTPPIWAQFATQDTSRNEHGITTKIPLNDERARADEIKLYTPTEYSPGKQRDFHGQQQPPTLGRKNARPKSIEIASASAKSLFQPILRKTSQSRKISNEQRQKQVAGTTRQAGKSSAGYSTDKGPLPPQSPQKGSRVMAAVANLDEKAKDAQIEALLDPRNIDAAFEAVLDSRNIPEPMRQKMRTLKSSLKADFIRSHKVEHSTGSDDNGNTLHSNDAETQPRKVGDVGREDGRGSESAVVEDAIGDEAVTPKRSRPRSRTFTFNKAESSPSKKQKGIVEPRSHRRDKSTDRSALKSPSSTSLVGMDDGKGAVRPQKGVKTVPPTEFVVYLHERTKPQDVEVGRLHKLRLLLRNETVAWVDTFIREGGMTEIIALLQRIMNIEWREEHEDALLHETLLCLKGLTTTDLALQKLNEVADTLFPALLGMLFDKERKGPSEFTTRQIVINILFTHLSTSTPALLHMRARTILSYLQDSAAPGGKETLPFVMDMRQPRPYRTWNKEVVDVTKEVFWIFLHQLNVVSLPVADGCGPTEPKAVEQTPSPESALSGRSKTRPLSVLTSIQAPTTPRPTSSRAEAAGFTRVEDGSYTTRHFPPPRPPVPAAPYVGGVEWDATNYLAAHLDLLNGLISALPSCEERNALRSLLRASGWEKVMGASLRTCKEKFYSAVHAGLRTWVGAASEDDWEFSDVRFGPREEDVFKSAKNSPSKRKEAPPQLELPATQLVPLGLMEGFSKDDGGMKREAGGVAGADGWTFDI